MNTIQSTIIFIIISPQALYLTIKSLTASIPSRIMSLSTLREPTVVLLDHTTYTPWLQQLETRCVSLDTWDQIDPMKTIRPKVKPTTPNEPIIRMYERRTNLGQNEDGEPRLPTMPSELSANGLKAWKEDTDYYRLQLESYKIRDREYREERANLDKVVVFIQSSVSPHLMKNCCKPGETLRSWLISLRDTVGIDAEEERLRARYRYLAALKPMRQPSNWDTWLAEYDHAATNAETEKVGELQNIQDTIQDFLDSVMKVAPTWTTIFQDHGRREESITRKDMMKRFREHMTKYHPVKGKQRGGAFVAGNESAFAAGGASTPGTDRDASHAAEVASSTPTIKGSRGRPRQKRTIGHSTTSKQSSIEDTAAAGGVKCPACEQRHGLDNCYYVHIDRAPDWFTPRAGIAAMVRHRLENDNDLQELLRGSKRARTKIPNMKISNSQTPEIDLE